jgi:hypothetical protein
VYTFFNDLVEPFSSNANWVAVNKIRQQKIIFAIQAVMNWFLSYVYYTKNYLFCFTVKTTR